MVKRKSIDTAALVAFYSDETKTLKDTAEHFGISRWRAKRRLWSAGVEIRRPLPERRPIDIDAAKSLRAEGLSILAIAERLGVPKSRLRKTLNAAGVDTSIDWRGRATKRTDRIGPLLAPIVPDEWVKLAMDRAKIAAIKTGSDGEDFVAWAWFGLVRAVRNWDRWRPWVPYAKTVIDDAITKSRLCYLYGGRHYESVGALNRKAGDTEWENTVLVAEKAGMPIDRVEELLFCAKLHRPNAVFVSGDGDDLYPVDILTVDCVRDAEIEAQKLVDEDLLGCLTPREREVVDGIYFDDSDRAEIGGRLGVTRQRVSQLELMALTKMRQKLNRRKLAAELRRKMGGSPKE